jgi:hypothetical protein
VTSIGEEAFRFCKSLTNITLPDGVKNIGWYAFTGCEGLTSFNVPKNVISISSPFESCVNLTTIYWNAKAIDESPNSSTSPLGSISN